MQWGPPSAFFGEHRSDNLKVKNARFRVDNVIPDPEKPIEVYLNGEKVAEIVIESRNTNQALVQTKESEEGRSVVKKKTFFERLFSGFR